MFRIAGEAMDHVLFCVNDDKCLYYYREVGHFYVHHYLYLARFYNKIITSLFIIHPSRPIVLERRGDPLGWYHCPREER